MICVDTTFLVDLWRQKDTSSSPARTLLATHPGEDFAVPAHAAGEFLEGGATVSPERMAQSLQFLRLFRIGEVNVETALRYAKIVAHLRRESALADARNPIYGSRPGRSSTSPPSLPETSNTSLTSRVLP